MIAPSVSSRRAFTLIELLVVISIIAILLTLLFPAAGAAIEAAKKTQAKNDATQIATAINAYVSEYGKMPTQETADVVGSQDAAIFDVLCPNPTSPPALNPRGITFLEVPKAKAGKNGRIDNAGPYMDSWGKAYFISLDADYDNQIDGPNGDKIRKTVLVWSQGNPEKSGYTDPTKWIKSWE